MKAAQERSVIRDIVLKVLNAQGITNPSEDVIDEAIKEHLGEKVKTKTNFKLFHELIAFIFQQMIKKNLKTIQYLSPYIFIIY